MAKISGIILTYNEEHNICEAINSISFADEIIIIDSYSTDATIDKISNLPNIKILKRKFKNYTDQRNFAINQAQFDWILFIDADERIPLALRNEIVTTTKSDTHIAGFMFRRKFFFNDKVINFSGFQTDTTYRLFKNGHVSYVEDKMVHEMPIIKGESAILKNKMHHYFIKNSHDYKIKMERYAKLKSLELFKKGEKVTVFHFIFRPFYKFFTNYFLRLGFLDGVKGFQLCYLGAYGVYFRYRELKRLIKFSPK